MKGTMRTVVMTGTGNMGFEEREIPQIGDGKSW
jgi:hypothetical protein